MPGFQPQVLVTDERERPLVSVDIHCIERATGRVLMKSTTNNEGVAAFNYIDDRAEVQYRAMNFRPSAENGNVRIKLLPKTTQDDVPPPLAVQTPGDGEALDPQTWLVFRTRPQSIAAETRSGVITIERRDSDDEPITLNDLVVYLYSTSSGGIFEIDDGLGGYTTVTTVTIPDGESTASFYYTDDTAGNPVLTASTEELL